MPRARKSPAYAFDPQSLDATLATILADARAGRAELNARLDVQDGTLAVIKEQAIKTNGRVGVLELWRETSKAKMAGIAAALGLTGGIIFELGKMLLVPMK